MHAKAGILFCGSGQAIRNWPMWEDFEVMAQINLIVFYSGTIQVVRSIMHPTPPDYLLYQKTPYPYAGFFVPV
jgi:hypothetical protein